MHFDNAAQAATHIRARLAEVPRVGVLAGTGLGGLADTISEPVMLPYAELPHFPLSTVTGHAGRLVGGRLAGTPVLIMQGRFHLYEGYRPAAVTFPIRVMQALGVERLIVTNAAGGLHPDFRPGDIMVIRDHINLTGENPLAGPDEARWGIRFPDMSRAYDPALIEAALAAGHACRAPMRVGVYAGLKGPSLETPAEIRFLRVCGADAVGFSTVIEVIAAVHAGMRVLGLSTITNVNDADRPQPATLEEILAVAAAAAPHLGAVIRAVLAGG